MFFKNFMEEVAAIEAAGEFEEFSGADVAEGEEVVGCINDDPYLMALFTVFKNRVEVLEGKIHQMTVSETRRAFEETNALKEIVWEEIRFHLDIFDGIVGLRKGWTVVRAKEEEQLTPLEPRIIGIVIPSDNCGDPNCIIHGGGGLFY